LRVNGVVFLEQPHSSIDTQKF